MELPKKNKLMLMFLAPANPLLKRIVRFATRRPLHEIAIEKHIPDITGISRETPKNWASGGAMRGSKAEAVFRRALRYLEERRKEFAKSLSPAEEQEYLDLRASIARYDAAIEEPAVDVHETARLLGMDVDECRRIIDTAIYDRYPLLKSIYYPARKDIAGPRDWAQEEFDRYDGIYLMWVRRGEIWLQAPLRVRYLQPLNAHKGEVRFIRCKMNFPDIRAGAQPPWHEYDGFMAIRSNRLYWTFEKRLSDRQDYFHLITNVAGPRGVSLSLHGRYLTTGQDEAQSVVTGDVFLDHMFCDRDDPVRRRYRDLMWTAAKAIADPQECRQVEQRWQALQTAANG